MRLNQAEFLVQDIINRMSLGEKNVERALLQAVTELNEVIAYDKAAKANAALQSANATINQFKAAVANFNTEYAAKIAALNAEVDPEFDSVKAKVAMMSTDFAALVADFQGYQDSVAAVIAAAERCRAPRPLGSSTPGTVERRYVPALSMYPSPETMNAPSIVAKTFTVASSFGSSTFRWSRG